MSETTKPLPLVKGGQGRDWEITEEEVLSAPLIVVALTATAIVLGALYGIVQVIGALT